MKFMGSSQTLTNIPVPKEKQSWIASELQNVSELRQSQ